MFKTSQRFHISSLCFLAITVFSLSSRAAQPADTRERRVEGRRWWEMIGGRSGDSLTHKEALRFSGSSRHPARLHPVCHQASMVLSRPEWLALLSFGFCTSCVAATHGRSRSCWLFILASFAPSPFSSSPLLHPSCLPLSLNPGSPHPDRRSNSLSTAASKWFHPPSPLSSPANDVPRSIILWCWLPQSSGCVCVCVCWGWGGVEEVVWAVYGEQKLRGEKKKKDESLHKRSFFMCCQACFPVIRALPFWDFFCLMITFQTRSLECSSGAVSPADIPQTTALLSTVQSCDNYSSLRLFQGFPPLYLHMRERYVPVTVCSSYDCDSHRRANVCFMNPIRKSAYVAIVDVMRSNLCDMKVRWTFHCVSLCIRMRIGH